MTTEVMSGIWSNHLDYTSYVGKAHWMDSGYLVPIIAYKYKISKIVVFDNSSTDTQHVDGGHCFTTYVYSYDETKCCVTTHTMPGLVHDICDASGNACMVFFWEQHHFMLFEYFDPCY
jgi:hypothetical protein